jgi:hypothetical protein
MDDHEEFEHVPWSELNAAASPSRPRSLYLAAAVVGAIVFGVLVGRFMGGPATPAAPGTSIEGGETERAAAEPSTTIGLPELPGLYSEADLMAFPMVTPERAAATRAEWFVYDYFTADMEPTGSADVLSALPAGAVLPEMPQDSASSLSYVEWARAFRVEEIGGGEYRVGVVFRLLGAPPDRGFFRLSARAVEVTVLVDEDGGTVVADLPAPIALPAGPEPAAWPDEGSEEIPAEVVDHAIVLARAWGDEPRVVVGQAVDGGWRVVLTLADEVGNRWPFAVRVSSG